ncbi:hypothetical protein GLAREA_08820 [Glarea lozoyensis ATCC 20868]|uniref:Centromere protein H C-terminal domain-containing protein n=1 Tax=Glarea lozoyensis (strain ATCC 20868 / MF5171) TaxID=1116229 RepID=S3DE02_GLAL2|nr:uncharacterized protein GLAREA_08820 [Glarea lozoyensis ATCC 20868]EPE36657.1 hypothetical protein GLAREA_08820 [Glarea lozoyensis ATCC 20868]
MADDAITDAMEGVEEAPAEIDQPLFTEQEQRVLDLYARMEELQLNIALLKSQGTLSQGRVTSSLARFLTLTYPDENANVTEEDIKAAQQGLLEAKTAYQLRNDIVESVLIANPILKAVHAGSNASTAEQDLLPLLEQRDTLSVTLADLSRKVLNAKKELIKVETENVNTNRQNAELAAQMISLAKDADTQKRDNMSRKAQKDLAEMDQKVKSIRQTWRIMKGTASGTIVGSGVDWARDPELLEIVLDNDEAGDG